MKRFGLAMAAVMLAGGCTSQASTNPQASAAAASEALPIKALMTHVIDPAADGVWDRQGWEVTAEGERETFPTDDAGWAQAESAAATVAESANLLLMSSRQQPGEAWGRYAAALRKSGLDAFHAAEARDKQAFFDAGGQIYAACAACHEHYIPEAGQSAAPAPQTEQRAAP